MIAAALGMITPSIVIILVIAMFIQNFLHIEAVRHAFNGIRVAVAALILNSAISMGRKSVRDYFCFAIFAASLAVFALFDISPIIPVVAGALAGIAYKQGRAAK
jgi:chromate transporter